VDSSGVVTGPIGGLVVGREVTGVSPSSIQHVQSPLQRSGLTVPLQAEPLSLHSPPAFVHVFGCLQSVPGVFGGAQQTQPSPLHPFLTISLGALQSSALVIHSPSLFLHFFFILQSPPPPPSTQHSQSAPFLHPFGMTFFVQVPAGTHSPPLFLHFFFALHGFGGLPPFTQQTQCFPLHPLLMTVPFLHCSADPHVPPAFSHLVLGSQASLQHWQDAP